VPSGATKSRQGVLPPNRQVAGSTVGVEPRTPQKLSLAIGVVIFPSKPRWQTPTYLEDPASFEIVAAAARSVNGITGMCYLPSNKGRQTEPVKRRGTK